MCILVRSGDFREGQQGSKMSPVITSQTRTFRAPVSDEVGTLYLKGYFSLVNFCKVHFSEKFRSAHSDTIPGAKKFQNEGKVDSDSEEEATLSPTKCLEHKCYR